jgi:gliding motility-associated-like protein
MKLFLLIKSALFFCFVFILNTSCLSQCDDSYQVLWGLNNGNSINVTHAAYTAQKDLLVCGSSGTKGILVHFNQTSGIKWAKTFAAGNTVAFRRVLVMSNGDITIGGVVTENNTYTLLIIRLDKSGNILWKKRLRDVSSVAGLTNMFLIQESLDETPDAGIVVCGRKYYKRNNDGAYNYRVFVFKLSAAGKVDWSREDTNGNDDEAFSLIMDQGSIVVVGNTYSIRTGVRYGFVEKLNPADGTVQMLKLYQLGSLWSNYFRSIEKSGNNYEIGTQAFTFGRSVYNVLRTNTEGAQLDCKQLPSIEVSLIDPYYYPVPLADGSTIVWKDWLTSANDARLAKLNASRGTAWNYQYTLAGKQSIYKVLPSGNNAAFAVGTSPNPQSPNGPQQIYLLQVKPDGTTDGCTNDQMDLNVKDSLNYTITTGSWQTTELDFQAPFDVSLAVQDVTLNATTICKSNGCQINSHSIEGDKVVCTPGATVTYVARISGTCQVPVQWSLSAPIGTVQTVNDSTIRVHYTNAGTATLKATFTTSCTEYRDEVTLQYSPIVGVLNLGPDKFICKGDTLTLSVDNQYSFIQWKDGSTKSNLDITAPGSYSVTVSNDHACYLKDTIQVNTYPKPIVHLAKDSVLCLPGIKILDAGNGFAHYQWQDGSTEPVFHVTGAGTYTVKVTDENGCSVSDTTTIAKLGQQPTNFAMFTDSTICAGEQVMLKVVGNYAGYNWNEGQSYAPGYKIDQPGRYHIKVRTADGCTGADSIIIHQKACTQTLNVPNAFTPNQDGVNDLFRAVAVGVVDYFDLQVYNRWGQPVFRTNDIHQGWNGKYQQRLQPMGAYTWIVRYRFAGSPTVLSQKGTVMLVW